MPESVQPYMSPGLFVTFWQLSLYDILVPMERYQNEVDRLKGIVRELDASIRAAVPTFPGQLVDKAAEAEAKRAQDRCMQTIQALNAELKVHTVAYEATRKRLLLEKNHWFSESSCEISPLPLSPLPSLSPQQSRSSLQTSWQCPISPTWHRRKPPLREDWPYNISCRIACCQGPACRL